MHAHKLMIVLTYHYSIYFNYLHVVVYKLYHNLRERSSQFAYLTNSITLLLTSVFSHLFP